jgi:hypothetical protein
MLEYIEGHPWWTLIYLSVICWTVVCVALAIFGKRKG